MKHPIFITLQLFIIFCSYTCFNLHDKGFKDVVIIGRGFYTARMLTKSCFFIQAVDKDGNAMDEITQQTFFTVTLESRDGAFLSADVIFLEETGIHKACYTIGELGTYKIKVQLVFTNYQFLTSTAPSGLESLGQLLSCSVMNVHCSVRHFYKNVVVAKSTIHVDSRQINGSIIHKRKLPPCSLNLLSLSRNRGFWKGQLWNPLACKPFRITPREVARCLDGKRILMIGDSEMRYHLAELMSFLSHGDRCFYLKRKWRRKVSSTLRGLKKTWRDGPPLDPETGKVGMAISKFGRGGMVDFLGSFWNGFAQARAQATEDATGMNISLPIGRFNVTLLVHLSARLPAVSSWMEDPELVGDSAVDSSSPFDFALVSGGLHDLAWVYSSKTFGHHLEKTFLPSVLELVGGDTKRVTWLGMWTAKESKKPLKYVPFSNNARGLLFEEEAKKALAKLNISQWLQVAEMSRSRPDLCLDSTHYSWPLSFAALELWLGSICRPFFQERQECPISSRITT